ncbi:hypothetical protein ACFL27_19460 [candidate division CSSED10-310 bacterium]|uniref:Uncharacterized protein n=1 Tax=candidate division CSSED10-310 bacterium TaxID=2855610 RepID=A0ABV6Z1Q4_UNCC1
MRKDKPSKTARKVALNIVNLGTKPGMDLVANEETWSIKNKFKGSL